MNSNPSGCPFIRWSRYIYTDGTGAPHREIFVREAEKTDTTLAKQAKSCGLDKGRFPIISSTYMLVNSSRQRRAVYTTANEVSFMEAHWTLHELLITTSASN